MKQHIEERIKALNVVWSVMLADNRLTNLILNAISITHLKCENVSQEWIFFQTQKHL